MSVTARSISTSNEPKGDTEARLLENALHLFSTKGYDATSIREIIEGAGVTRPVLYYYFKNKEDLFLKIVEAEFAKAFAEIDEIIAEIDSCANRLKALIQRVFDRVENSPETVQLMLRYFFAPPANEEIGSIREKLIHERFLRLIRIMQDGLDCGELKSGDGASLALAFSGIMDMHVMVRAGNPEPKLTAAHGEALVTLFFEGANSESLARKPLQFNAPL